MQEKIAQATVMPASKLTIPTITGTHTGMEEEHLGTRTVGAGLELVLVVVVVSEIGVSVVEVITGGLGRLLILVRMKGLAYRNDK